MADHTRDQARKFGYRYLRFPLERSADLEGRLPPCTFKPEIVQRGMKQAQEGELCAWLDADAVLVKPLDVPGSCDAYVTLREPEMIGASRSETNTINAGVAFFRNTPAARILAARWRTATTVLGNDQWALGELIGQGWTFEQWKESYGSVARIPIGPETVTAHILDAREWNCWWFDAKSRPIREKARVLHFKGDLRRKYDWRKFVAS